MAYSTEIAGLLADQLSKFATLNRHQLAGHVANIEFWLDEVAHCLRVIDGYDVRFEQMKGAQQRYVVQHETKEFDPWDHEHGRSPSPPRRVSGKELSRARRDLCVAVHRFLVRCLDERFIGLERFDIAHERLGIDPAELRRS